MAVAIEDFRPTVVHAWLDHAIVIAGLVSCVMGVPKFIGGLHNLPEYLGSWIDVYMPVYRTLATHPNATLTSAGPVGARLYEQFLNLPLHSIKVQRNMFWPESVRSPSHEEIAAYRGKLAIAPEAAVVGTVIRFVEAKDPYLWLETAAQVARALPHARFVMAGYGEMLDLVADRVRDLGLSDRVVLSGPIDDVSLLYALCDVVLLTSRTEASPIVLIEAQALGRPVVAPDVGEIRESVLEGVTARIVSGRSASAYAEAVIATLNEPEYRIQAAIRGPQFVNERFNRERVIDSMLALYGLPLAAR